MDRNLGRALRCGGGWYVSIAIAWFALSVIGGGCKKRSGVTESSDAAAEAYFETRSELRQAEFLAGYVGSRGGDSAELQETKAVIRRGWQAIADSPYADAPSDHVAAQWRDLKQEYWAREHWILVSRAEFAGVTNDSSDGGFIVVCEPHKLRNQGRGRPVSYRQLDQVLHRY
jgi:hypothetical protein